MMNCNLAHTQGNPEPGFAVVVMCCREINASIHTHGNSHSPNSTTNNRTTIQQDNNAGVSPYSPKVRHPQLKATCTWMYTVKQTAHQTSAWAWEGRQSLLYCVSSVCRCANMPEADFRVTTPD